MRALLLAIALAACAAPQAAAEMDDLTPLLGCWNGAFAGQAGIVDERCFEPLEGGHIVDRHFVRPTDYSGETTYHLDTARGGIVFAYSASDGGRSNGSVARGADGALVFPPHTYIGSDGAEQRLRSTWRFEAPDRFVAVSEREEGGVWRPLMTIRYERVPAEN